MSTAYLDCAICGQELGSAHEMIVLREQGDMIEEAAHPECYEDWQEAEAEDAAEESEARARAQAEAEVRWWEEWGR